MRLSTSLFGFVALGLALSPFATLKGEEFDLTPGKQLNPPSPLHGVSLWTLDLGYHFPVLPENEVLFETGGDGTGLSLSLIREELVLYLDCGAPKSDLPHDDAYAKISLRGLLPPLTIRVGVDLRPPTAKEDRLTLTVLSADGNLEEAFFHPVKNTQSASGDNALGLGHVASDIAGRSEAPNPPFGVLKEFATPIYRQGKKMIPPSRIAGKLYTRDSSPPNQLQDPSLWKLSHTTE